MCCSPATVRLALALLHAGVVAIVRTRSPARRIPDGRIPPA